MKEKPITYPIRINKYLAEKKYSTRVGADELIKKGLVRINGRTAVLGDKIQNPSDMVEVLSLQKSYSYYAYNKPVGIVTTSPQKDEQAILDITRFPKKVFPLGRLDKDSHGLILLTDDGRITKRLLEPQFDHEKEYYIRVDKPVAPDFLKKLERGVVIDGYKTKPCTAHKLGADSFTIILTEGKNRQIRKMCQELGRTVLDLRRVRIMNIQIGTLPEGAFREIEGKELRVLLASLGL